MRGWSCQIMSMFCADRHQDGNFQPLCKVGSLSQLMPSTNTLAERERCGKPTILTAGFATTITFCQSLTTSNTTLSPPDCANHHPTGSRVLLGARPSRPLPFVTPGARPSRPQLSLKLGPWPPLTERKTTILNRIRRANDTFCDWLGLNSVCG